MNEISKLIKMVANGNTPTPDYFENFLHSYKTYHKRQNVRRTICKAVSIIAAFIIIGIMSIAVLEKVYNNKLDIQTAAGIEHESK